MYNLVCMRMWHKAKKLDKYLKSLKTGEVKLESFAPREINRCGRRWWGITAMQPVHPLLINYSSILPKLIDSSMRCLCSNDFGGEWEDQIYKLKFSWSMSVAPISCNTFGNKHPNLRLITEYAMNFIVPALFICYQLLNPNWAAGD